MKYLRRMHKSSKKKQLLVGKEKEGISNISAKILLFEKINSNFDFFQQTQPPQPPRPLMRGNPSAVRNRDGIPTSEESNNLMWLLDFKLDFFNEGQEAAAAAAIAAGGHRADLLGHHRFGKPKFCLFYSVCALLFSEIGLKALSE